MEDSSSNGTSSPENPDQNEVTLKVGKEILEKQFETYVNIQDDLFQAIRIISIGIAAIVGIISILPIPSISMNDLSSIFEDNINEIGNAIGYDLAYILTLLLVIVLLTIGTGLVIVLIFYVGNAMYGILLGLGLPKLEPLETKYSITSDESNDDLYRQNLESWIQENHSTIEKAGDRLDDAYESILISAFTILAIVSTGGVILSGDLRLYLMYLGTLLPISLAFKWRDSGELFKIDPESYNRRQRVIFSIASIITLVLIAGGLIIDIVV